MKATDYEATIEKESLGHEGELCFEGKLLYKGKPIGTWADSHYGGMRDVTIPKDEDAHKCNAAIRKFFKDVGFMNPLPSEKGKNIVPWEENPLTKGDKTYINMLIRLTVEAEKKFDKPLSKCFKHFHKKGKENVVALTFEHRVLPPIKAGEPSVSYHTLTEMMSMNFETPHAASLLANGLSHYERDKNRSGQQMLLVRDDGKLQSCHDFEKEMNARIGLR